MDAAPTAEPPEAGARPTSPYVGLVPFGEGDSDFFFGRSRETAIVTANLRANRLTIVYGPSGVGKSSLLMAGVVHGLRGKAAAAGAEPTFPVCVYRDWPGDPVSGIAEAIRAASGATGADDPATLAEVVQSSIGPRQRLLLVLDQFEEYFQYHPDEGGKELTGFAGELAAIVNESTVGAHILLSVREDAWAKLDLFKGHIPSLFNNYVRIDHLDVASARMAITEPIDAWNKTLPPGAAQYSIEPALTDAVLKDVAVGSLGLTESVDAPKPADASGERIEAPFLQLVLDRLWRDMIESGGHTLMLARLEALGGAATIVKDHLLDALAKLSPAEQDVASDCFRFLVSSDRTKIARSAADLAEGTERSQPEVTVVLDELCMAEGGRILRENAPAHAGGSASYELFHDILAEPILAWRRAHEAERRRRVFRRRLIRIGVVAAVLIAVLAAFAAFAWVQRDQAISEKKTAASLALAGTASSLAANRLDESLLLALALNGPKSALQARSALTLALATARSSGLDAIVHTGSDYSVQSVAFSRDGDTMATGSGDGTVLLWDVRHRRALGQPLDTRCSVSAIAFGATGRTLATACHNGTVQLWNTDSGSSVSERACSSVQSLAFAGHGKELAAGCFNGTVRRWRVANGLTQMGSPNSSGKPVFGLQPDRAGHLLAAVVGGLAQNMVQVRDITSGLQTKALPSACGSIDTAAISPNGRLLATGCYTGEVQVWNLTATTMKRRADLHVGCGAVNALVFAQDSRTLLGGCSNGKVALWDLTATSALARGRPLSSTSCDGVASLAVSPDGKTLAAGCLDGTAQLWHLALGPGLGAVTLARRDCVPNGSVLFSPDTTILAAACQNGEVQLWQTATGAPAGTAVPSKNGHDLTAAAFSPDGQTLAAGSINGLVGLWKRPAPHALKSRAFETTAIAYGPKGAAEVAVAGLTSGVGAGEIDILPEGSLQPARKITLPKACDLVHDLEFAPGAHRLAAGCFDGNTVVWNLTAPTQPTIMSAPACDSVVHVAFSPVPSSNTLAVSCQDGTVELWNVTSPGQPLTLAGGGGGAGIAFSPDGRALATGDPTGEVRLWDVATGAPLGEPLPNGSGPVSAVAFTPDGTTLVTYDSGTIRRWPGILSPDPASVRALVCSFVWGGLSQSEWHTLAPSDLGYPGGRAGEIADRACP